MCRNFLLQCQQEIKKRPTGKNKVVINLTNCAYQVVRDAALFKGWTILVDQEGELEKEWTVYWQDRSVQSQRVMNMDTYQRLNHFPGMTAISRKNGLAMRLLDMQKMYPDEYNFFPDTWVLPRDWPQFKNQFNSKTGLSNKTYIIKPDAGCQGEGIFLTRTVSEVDPYEMQVAQRYLNKPLLVEGYKFDLRIYVLVLSCDPLTVYIYDEGLVRICTEKYVKPSATNFKKSCMHLTNYAINKHNDKFAVKEELKVDGAADGGAKGPDQVEATKDESVDGDGEANSDAEAAEGVGGDAGRPSAEHASLGNKRSLQWFRGWLQDQGHDHGALWENIQEVVLKTLIPVQPLLAHTYKSCIPTTSTEKGDTSACFELLGFDIMVDKSLKPWVIEVNHSPSFGVDSKLDYDIKFGAIKATLSMLNVHSKDKQKCKAIDSVESKRRLYGSNSDSAAAASESREKYREKMKARLKKREKLNKMFTKVYPKDAESDAKYEKLFEAANSIIGTPPSRIGDSFSSSRSYYRDLAKGTPAEGVPSESARRPFSRGSLKSSTLNANFVVEKDRGNTHTPRQSISAHQPVRAPLTPSQPLHKSKWETSSCSTNHAAFALPPSSGASSGTASGGRKISTKFPTMSSDAPGGSSSSKGRVAGGGRGSEAGVTGTERRVERHHSFSEGVTSEPADSLSLKLREDMSSLSLLRLNGSSTTANNNREELAIEKLMRHRINRVGSF